MNSGNIVIMMSKWAQSQETLRSGGNKFTIELESVLYSCPSCQRHLMMLVEYGKINGKTINIKFIAHPGATTMNELKSITK